MNESLGLPWARMTYMGFEVFDSGRSGIPS